MKAVDADEFHAFTSTVTYRTARGLVEVVVVALQSFLIEKVKVTVPLQSLNKSPFSKFAPVVTKFKASEDKLRKIYEKEDYE